LSKITEALTGLRERAKPFQRRWHQGSDQQLFNNVLQLQDVVLRLSDENKELKQQLEQQQLARGAVPKIKQVGDTNYYSQGDEGPFSAKVAVTINESWSPCRRRKVRAVGFAGNALSVVSSFTKRGRTTAHSGWW